MKVLDEDIDDWAYTYGDTVKHELLQSGSEFTVKSSVNGQPLSLGGSDGEMPLEEFNEYFMDRMYYGSIADAQKVDEAENPDNYMTRDSAYSESNMQWWSK